MKNIAFCDSHLISRRTALKGLSALTVIACSGCTPFSSNATLSPTPTARPLGSVFYTYHGHTDRATAVAWSPDGGRIASGSLDKTVQVWGVTNGSHATIYRGHTDGVMAVAWSPDSHFVVSGSLDTTAHVWDVTAGSSSNVYHGHTARINAVVWSPDGKYIASGSLDKTVQIWGAAANSAFYTYHGHTGEVTTAAWSPKGKYIATGSADKTVQVWEATTGTLLYTYRGHTNTVTGITWSPDGKYVASGSLDKTVQVWEAATGSLLYTYHGYNVEAAKANPSKGVLPDLIFSVAWSHNGKRLAAITQVYCGDICAEVLFWDATTGHNVSFYPDFPIFALAWSPDDTRIVTAVAPSLVQITKAS